MISKAEFVSIREIAEIVVAYNRLSRGESYQIIDCHEMGTPMADDVIEHFGKDNVRVLDGEKYMTVDEFNAANRPLSPTVRAMVKWRNDKKVTP